MVTAHPDSSDHHRNIIPCTQCDFQGLSMVTAHPDSSDQGKLGLEGEPSKRGHDWLLKHLPALPVFPFVMAQMCETLRQVGAGVRWDFCVVIVL